MTMSLRTSPVSPQSQEDMDFMDYRMSKLQNCNYFAVYFCFDFGSTMHTLSQWTGDDILLPPTPYNQLYAECTDKLDIDEALTLRNGALSIVDESMVMNRESNALSFEDEDTLMEKREMALSPMQSVQSVHSVHSPSSSSPQGIYEWLVSMKRLLLNGFVRCLWKESLQFNDDKLLCEYPNEMLMEQILRWMTVSDCIDEYSTNLNILVNTQRIFHLTQYRRMQTIQRTKEWNRKCYHCFGSDTISRGGRAIWKFKCSERDGQRPCVLIGVVEEDEIEKFVDHQDAGSCSPVQYGIGSMVSGYGMDCGTFNDAQHRGFAVYTGDWNAYHSETEGQPFLNGGAAVNQLNLTPNDVVAVELDLEPKGEVNANRCGTLKFMVNGRVDMFKCGGIAFDDIDIDKSYRLAIGMYLRDRIELYQVL